MSGAGPSPSARGDPGALPRKLDAFARRDGPAGPPARTAWLGAGAAADALLPPLATLLSPLALPPPEIQLARAAPTRCKEVALEGMSGAPAGRACAPAPA